MAVIPVVPKECFNTWRVLGEQGVSSNAIMDHLTGEDRDGTRSDYPRDAGDFRRCEELLQAVPEAREHLDVVVARSPQWAAIIGEWDQLVQLLKDGLRRSLTHRIVHLVEEADSSTVEPSSVPRPERLVEEPLAEQFGQDRVKEKSMTSTATYIPYDRFDDIPMGEAARAMARSLSGRDVGYVGEGDHPEHPGSFEKCEELLDHVPEARECLHLLAARSLAWASIVDQWDDLVALKAAGKNKQMLLVLEEASTRTGKDKHMVPVLEEASTRTETGQHVARRTIEDRGIDSVRAEAVREAAAAVFADDADGELPAEFYLLRKYANLVEEGRR